MGSGRRAVPLVVVSLVLALLVSDAVSQPSFPAPPPSGRFVTDLAEVIGKGDESEIDRLATALLTEGGYPVSVVTIRSLAAQGAGGYTLERYAVELLKAWAQDERARSYGMLLLVAADDRMARIQLGSAWGHAHDHRAHRVLNGLILPAFRKGHLSAGILQGVRGFDAMGRQLALPTFGQPFWMARAELVDGLDAPSWMLPALVAGGLLVLVGLVSLVRRGRRSWAWMAAVVTLGRRHRPVVGR
jgi:uncharacterized protein